jgi:glucose/arabinose dehydrogenase
VTTDHTTTSRGRARRAAIAAAALVIAFLATSASAAAQGLQLVPFGGQAFNLPFHVTGAPGDPSRVFVVEGTGRIRLVKDGVTQPTPFLDISASVFDATEGCGGECGMFSVAFPPDYASSGLFYVFYTRDFNPGNHYLRIEEFRRFAGNPDVADPGYRRTLLEIPHTNAANHNGGQLQFGPDKYLYIWVGDGGNGQSANAQNGFSLLGKLLRIDPRGGSPYAIPADNPFGTPIYAYGLRNPWRGSFDRSTGDLTIGDVGQGTWEEIDFKPEGAGLGANFGWDCFEGTSPFSGCAAPNHSPPVHQYANGAGGAAIAGGFVIRDSALPSWQGRYIYADTFDALGNQIRTVDLLAGAATDAPTVLTATNLASFGQDACGHIYTAELGGQVSRLQPTSGGFPCKLAPELTLKAKKAKKAADKGAVIVRVACDEDCDAVGDATIKIKGRKRKLNADADGARVQIGELVRLKLDLSKKETRRLRKALKRGRKAKARIEVSATGGGGGTDTERRKVKQRD